MSYDRSKNHLNSYQFIGQLGRGSYGIVYKVRSKNDKKFYVLKKIELKLIKVFKQAQIMKQINCPYIIKYYNSFKDQQNFYIVMEYAEGGDLQTKQKQKGQKLEQNIIWKIAKQILLAIDYLHKNNIIHRDIKALNVLLSKQGTVKIADMGVSKFVKNSYQLQNTRVGTPLYLSPQLVKHQPYDQKIDIWSIGCVLYYVTCLQPPFKAKNLILLGHQIVSSTPKPIPKIYSKRLQKLIQQLLSKSAKNRPSASQILKQYSQFQQKRQIMNSTLCSSNFEKVQQIKNKIQLFQKKDDQEIQISKKKKITEVSSKEELQNRKSNKKQTRKQQRFLQIQYFKPINQIKLKSLQIKQKNEQQQQQIKVKENYNKKNLQDQQNQIPYILNSHKSRPYSALNKYKCTNHYQIITMKDLQHVSIYYQVKNTYSRIETLKQQKQILEQNQFEVDFKKVDFRNIERKQCKHKIERPMTGVMKVSKNFRQNIHRPYFKNKNHCNFNLIVNNKQIIYKKPQLILINYNK